MSESVASAEVIQEAATCPAHEQPSVGVCGRCGVFLCEDCRASSAGEALRCEGCREKEAPRVARVEKAQSLAKASWVAFLIMLGVGIMLPGEKGGAITVLLRLLLCSLGFGAGVAALFRRRGTDAPGVIAPAVIGIVLNGLVLLAFVLGLLAAIFLLR